jgi:hypothetical protein
MFGDILGFRHARIVNHDHFIAARVNQKRRERENQNNESDGNYFHVLVHVLVFDFWLAKVL